MNAAEPIDPLQDQPTPLWRIAAAFMHLLYNLFGGPEDVAARQTLTAAAHAHLASWLRCAEALTRRLLLIEASAYPKPNTRPLLHAPRKRLRRLVGFHADKPEHWRVSFRCFALDRGAQRKPPIAAPAAPDDVNGKRPRRFVFREEPPPPRPSAPRPNRAARRRYPPVLRQDREWVLHQPPRAFRSAWPLAERYEALLRVCNHPAAYARRLARRLHATPHRAGELLRAPPEATHRIVAFPALTQPAKALWRFNLS